MQGLFDVQKGQLWAWATDLNFQVGQRREGKLRIEGQRREELRDRGEKESSELNIPTRVPRS
jgi:hypothetical protein